MSAQSPAATASFEIALDSAATLRCASRKIIEEKQFLPARSAARIIASSMRGLSPTVFSRRAAELSAISGAAPLAAALCFFAPRADKPYAKNAAAWAATLDAQLHHELEVALARMSGSGSERFAPPSMFAKLPAARSIQNPAIRTWALCQINSPVQIAVELFKSGLGLAQADDLGLLIRGAGSIGSQSAESGSASELFEALLRAKCLDGHLGGVGKDSLYQTLLRKARCPYLALEAFEALSRSGVPAGCVYEGQHPLWILAEMRGFGGNGLGEAEAACKAFDRVMDLGFGPNMELPGGMRLSLTPTQKNNNAPTLPLEWAKRHEKGLAMVAISSARHKLELEARNSRGETLLGVANRMARQPVHRQRAIMEFKAIHRLGADPLNIAPLKEAHSIAANDHMRQLAASHAEKLALRAALDEDVVARAKELMAAKRSNSAKDVRKPRL